MMCVDFGKGSFEVEWKESSGLLFESFFFFFFLSVLFFWLFDMTFK